MKIRYSISFGTGLEGPAGLTAVREVLESAGCASLTPKIAQSILAGHFMTTFDADDPRLAALRQVLERSDLRWSETREHIYEDEELIRAPLLLFGVTAPGRDVGRPNKNRFDFSSACPACGTGARQIAPLRVKTASLPKRGSICQTLDFEYLVTEPLSQSLARARVSGMELMQVASRKGDRLAWWQIIPRIQLPPMAPETRGIVRGRPQDACAECRRDNWFQSMDEPAQIVYHRTQFAGSLMPDVAETYECFGNSNEFSGYIAKGAMLVSAKVFSILRRARATDICVEPVKIVDD